MTGWRDQRGGASLRPLPTRGRTVPTVRGLGGDAAATTAEARPSSTSATREGLLQVVINPEHAPAASGGRARAAQAEFVVSGQPGPVVRRAPETVNPLMATGEIEIQAVELEILSRSTPLPFQLDDEGVDETLRLRYRWLDLRRAKMQGNIRTRAKLISIIRSEMESEGFIEIETPIMAKPTPEGARDFLVPTRLQPGRFFALPQEPQILQGSRSVISRLRALLPGGIRPLLSRRGSPGRPVAGDHPARCRDGLPGPRVPVRR